MRHHEIWMEPVRMLGRDDPSPGLYRGGASHYSSTPSQRYRAAVTALQQLEDVEPGEAEAAAAEVVQHPRHALVVRAYGQPTWFSGCALRALGRVGRHDCDDSDGHGQCLPPGTDHPRLLRRRGKTTGLLIQPYDVSWESLEGLVTYCQQHRLEARIVGAGSYHYPSRTVAIVLTPAECESVQAQVREALERFDWAGTNEIREVAGVDRNACVRALKELVDGGAVELMGEGRPGNPYQYRLAREPRA